jgi:hypothetical protein
MAADLFAPQVSDLTGVATSMPKLFSAAKGRGTAASGMSEPRRLPCRVARSVSMPTRQYLASVDDSETQNGTRECRLLSEPSAGILKNTD